MKKLPLCLALSAALAAMLSSSVMAAEVAFPEKRLPSMNAKPRSVAPAATIAEKADIDGFQRTWKLYVPERCKGDRPVPLVVALHGFGGPSMDYSSAWHMTAEREGFIVLYPEAMSPKWWNIWELRSDAPDDVSYLDYVIEDTCRKYAVDRSRIYLTGVSMGDNMATTYAFRRADRLAAVAPTDGPTLPSILVDPKSGDFRMRPEFAVPSLRLHAELDSMAGLPSTYQQYSITQSEYDSVVPLAERRALRHMMDESMKKLWLEKNGCAALPKLHLDERRNFAIYAGADHCDYVACSTLGEGHGGGFERSDLLWDFLSCFARKDGKVIRAKAASPVVADRNAVAIAAGAGRAYVDNTLVDMPKGMAMERNGELFLPVSFLPVAFPGTTVSFDRKSETAVVNWKGKTLKMGSERPLMLMDGKVLDCPEPFMAKGELMAPARTLARDFYVMHYDDEFEAAYISEQPAKLSYDFAADFRVMLGRDKAPKADISMEKAAVQKILDSRKKQ
ncbi:PHB depolymerase family esterase [uncultured Mailhella sp.]|uniref:alpha/beta hydrolase family esterase n=1 Tax=uncultured Mailhella sp. TaxID=1981031 RepID=UPI0025CDFD36|nr:PHB depolymerase family esterase [uncultured Mailhella sp.]